jgi:hypothetical protein
MSRLYDVPCRPAMCTRVRRHMDEVSQKLSLAPFYPTIMHAYTSL